MIADAHDALHLLSRFSHIEVNLIGSRYVAAAGGDVQRVSGEGATPVAAIVDAARNWSELMWKQPVHAE